MGKHDKQRRRNRNKIVGGWFAALGGERSTDDPRSELSIFAGFFHQDFDLEDDDAYEFARKHFEGISKARRTTLKRELVDLLEFRKSKRALMNAWYRLGAQSWQKGLDLRTALRDFVDML